MKAKIKPEYKLKKKYINGVQNVNPNIDPTTTYSNNRKQSTGEMEFNNAQQSLNNQSGQRIQSQDKYTAAQQNYTDTQAKDTATTAGVASALGKIPGYGQAASAIYTVGNKVGSGFANSAYKKEATTGKANYGDQLASSITTDTGTKLLNSKSGADVLNAFVPFLDNNKTSTAKEAKQTYEANQRNQYTNNQLNKFGVVDTTEQSKQLKEGSSGIHIKPSHKGLLHKKLGIKEGDKIPLKDLTIKSGDSPNTIKQKTFAKNAKSWSHKALGSKDLTLDNLIKGHSKSYKTIEKKESPKVEKDELKEFKKLKTLESKYKMKSGTREIETEGREPIFSPKKSDGSRDLLYYNPSAPTHEKGGVPAEIVSESRYKLKSGNSKLQIPEGSAIVTAKDNKNKEALNAYKSGNKYKLNKIIDKMPEDKPRKKAYGVNSLDDPDYNKGNIDAGNGVGGGLNNINTSSNLGSASKSNQGAGALNTTNSIGGGLGTLAPTIYNLTKGAQPAYKTQRNYVNNEQYKYVDTSNPLRRAANEEYRVNENNIRNATSGNGGNYLANSAIASANRFKNMSDIENQQSGRRVDVNNANVDVRNNQRNTNLQLNNEYNNQDLQNRAAQNRFLGAGMEGLSQYSQMNQLNNNRTNADNIRLNLLGTSNYKTDKKGNISPKDEKKLGSKNLKYKMKR